MSLLALCEGNPPVTVGYHDEGAVMQTVFQYSDVFMKQRSHISYVYTCHYQNRALHAIACQQGPLLLARIKQNPGIDN